MPDRPSFAALCASLAAMLAVSAPMQAAAEASQQAILANFVGDIDFGDDSGDYARDGECDDLRFAGDGMTQTPLLPEDIYHDASDCRAAFQANTITLAPLFVRLSGEDEIVWGDDNGDYSRDGECDDLRFEGTGMTFTPLIVEDIGHDASDCRAAYKAGSITWRSGPIGRLDQPALYA